MIDDLDKTLAALLRRGLSLGLSEQIRASFEAPEDRFPRQSVSMRAVDLLRENIEFRSNETELEKHRDGTLANPAEGEHHLLGVVMRTLLRFRTLPRDLPRSTLARSNMPLPVSALQTRRLHSLGECRQAMSGKPKAAINYTVALSIDVGASEAGHLVKERIVRFEERARSER